MNSPTDETFSSISPAEFFYRNRQMAGFGNPTQAVYSTIRELVENSIDACEQKQIMPKIRVSIHTIDSDELSISVDDNGVGVPTEEIPAAFGRVLYGSKYDARQRRGTFGLGVTMAILYGQITTDTPVLIHSQTENSPGILLSLSIDVENNEPIVLSQESLMRKSTGTCVKLHIRGDLKRSIDRVVEYLSLTTVGTPHACIVLDVDMQESLTWGPYSDECPSPTITCKPHPRSADFEILRRLMDKNPDFTLHQFLVENFQQVGTRTATKFLSFMAFDPSERVSKLSRRAVTKLSRSLQKYDAFSRPDSRCLSVIGKRPMQSAIKSLYDPLLVAYDSRDPSEWNGHPFILEGAIALGSSFPVTSLPTLYRFANRVPLLYDASEDLLTKVLRKTRWTRYGLKSPKSVAIFINLCSTRVPYKAAGKQSIASIPQIEEEIKHLMNSLGRKLNKSLKKTDKIYRDKRRIRMFTKYFEKITSFSADLADYPSVPSVSSMIDELFEVDTDV
ncbi:MAG: Type 2 DNA topoisomerase 6 subunit B [Candidatus Thorarchaeota archaeon]|nr:MAG: Type 2 DNA topoisomerase 6 subunit B [Candidatus Thorarchaeota archaeon]